MNNWDHRYESDLKAAYTKLSPRTFHLQSPGGFSSHRWIPGLSRPPRW